MHRPASFVVIAVLMIPRLSAADPEAQAPITQGESSPEARQVIPARDTERARPFAAGVRFGLFPPILTAVEFTVRPINHLAFNVYGIYLPGAAGPAIGGKQLTL